MNAKEIAERIVNDSDTTSYYTDDIEPLARAYLDLEKTNQDMNLNASKVMIDQQSEITKLKEELAAEKADKQRVLDIGVKMQREVNDRVEAKNAGLIEALKDLLAEISAPMINDERLGYNEYQITNGAIEDANASLKKWGGI